jgi:hypothetical protein
MYQAYPFSFGILRENLNLLNLQRLEEIETARMYGCVISKNTCFDSDERASYIRQIIARGDGKDRADKKIIEKEVQ